jgi:hypothetical protein
MYIIQDPGLFQSELSELTQSRQYKPSNMGSENRFASLILDPSRDETGIGLAYKYLGEHPEQLLGLFFKEETQKFLSEFFNYGPRLATVLERVPEHFQYMFHDQHEFSLGWRMYEETLGTFLLTLLRLSPPRSLEEIAAIVTQIVLHIRPGSLLELIGQELCENSSLAQVLIWNGSMRDIQKKSLDTFQKLMWSSWEDWGNHALIIIKACDEESWEIAHSWKTDSVLDWNHMEKLVAFIPCKACRFTPSTLTDIPETPVAQVRNYQRWTNTTLFTCLLGDHLGVWKILLSDLALGGLRKAAKFGEFVFAVSYRWLVLLLTFQRRITKYRGRNSPLGVRRLEEKLPTRGHPSE